MSEERTAYRIKQALNHGLEDIPESTSRRLAAARQLALSRQKQEAPALIMATTHGQSWAARHGDWHLSPVLKQLLPIIALLVGMWIAFYWHSLQYIQQLEQVDSALLAEDLPPEVFLDKDVFEWLLDDTPEE